MKIRPSGHPTMPMARLAWIGRCDSRSVAECWLSPVVPFAPERFAARHIACVGSLALEAKCKRRRNFHGLLEQRT